MAAETDCKASDRLDRECLAATIEHCTGDLPPEERFSLTLPARRWRTILAALRSEAGAAMREGHRVEALKAEARDRAFRHELAESTLANAQEKWLRVGKLALAGNLEPLRRRIAYIESPPQIFGSGRSLPLQLEGGEANALPRGDDPAARARQHKEGDR